MTLRENKILTIIENAIGEKLFGDFVVHLIGGIVMCGSDNFYISHSDCDMIRLLFDDGVNNADIAAIRMVHGKLQYMTSRSFESIMEHIRGAQPS